MSCYIVLHLGKQKAIALSAILLSLGKFKKINMTWLRTNGKSRKTLQVRVNLIGVVPVIAEL